MAVHYAPVDLDIFEKYLEEHEIHPDGYPELQIGKRGSQLLRLFIIVILLYYLSKVIFCGALD